MTAFYQAMQISHPGRLELLERPVPVPEAGEVLIRVEACGICGADRGDIENADPAARRVPGHEVVGRLMALGSNVPAPWQVGQRVGVGRFGGHCGSCQECRRGRFHLCRQQPVMGSSRDGGYAEMMTARATGLVAIPDELSSEEAAPILCAGIATFNGLKASGAEPGDTVAILGIGGLGHLAVQYARRMGFRVIALGRGSDIASDALELGAHRYVDILQEDAAAVLSDLGGAAAIRSPHPTPLPLFCRGWLRRAALSCWGWDRILWRCRRAFLSEESGPLSDPLPARLARTSAPSTSAS